MARRRDHRRRRRVRHGPGVRLTAPAADPLRIALLTYSTRPRGGVVHTLALAEALAGQGHQVTVWSLARGGDTAFFRPLDPAVEIRLAPVPDVEGEPLGERVARSIGVLREALRERETYDVVHAQDCISANATEHCLRTVHHLDHFTTPQLVACHERAIRRPSAHVCVSAAVARELRDGWGIEATVIPNGVDAARFAAGTADRQRWQQRFGRYVLAVGGIEPRKGTADLIEAMHLLRRSHPGVPLVVAGGETLFDYRDYRAAVLDRAAALGVAPILLGPVPHEDLPGLVAGAAVLAFPSTREGFGLAAMEALAAGVPVVTRDLPVLREVFDGAATFAVDAAGFAAGLAAVLDGTAPDRILAGKALAARHTWDAAARAHVALYRAHLDRTG